MATEVIVTADFEAWWDCLGIEEQKSVAVVVAKLEERGPTLPFPYSSGITGSTKLRELRVQHAGKPYRILYAFDPKCNAILLLGGTILRRRWLNQLNFLTRYLQIQAAFVL